MKDATLKKIPNPTSNKDYGWFKCKGTVQPTIRRCTGCPMFTVRDNNPICLYKEKL